MSDPIASLMENTRQGHCSRIRYDKGTGPGEWRLIEPRTLVDGVYGITVRALQLDPKVGLRTFLASRIADVAPDPRAISSQKVIDAFCSGEIKTRSLPPDAASRGRGGTLVLMVSSGSLGDASSSRPAPASIWFIEYAHAVRLAISDLSITPNEAAAVKRRQAELGLTASQVAAVHAYVLAEEMMGLAADGMMDDCDSKNIDRVCDCLHHLGWCPLR